MKTEKKGKWKLAFIAAALVFLIIIGLQAYSIAPAKYCVESENGELICMKSSDKQLLAIVPAQTTYDAGDKVDLSFSLTLPPYEDIYSAAVILYDFYGVQLDAWSYTNELRSALGCTTGDFASTCPSSGSSNYFNALTSLTAPSQSGEYQVCHKIGVITQGSLTKVIDECARFTVGASSCPQTVINPFELVQTVPNGDWYARTTISYGAFPACSQNINNEFKTECDGGYLARGYDSRVADALVPCIVQTEDITCYQCSAGEIITSDFSTGCPSNWQNTIPVCEQDNNTNNTLETGYSLFNGACVIDTQEPQFATISECADAAIADLQGYALQEGLCVQVQGSAQYETKEQCELFLNPDVDAGYIVENNECVFVEINPSFSSQDLCLKSLEAEEEPNILDKLFAFGEDGYGIFSIGGIAILFVGGAGITIFKPKKRKK